MLVAAPVLISTCVGPCYQDTPGIAVTHRLDGPVAITLGEESLGMSVPPGELTNFSLLGDGRPLPELRLQSDGDEPIVFDLDVLVPTLRPSDCVVVLVESCAPGSPDACATQLDSGERDGHSFECRAPLMTAMETASPTDTDGGDLGSSGTESSDGT